MSLVQEKQKELKDCIKKIGMTQKYFIEQYCIETFNNFTEKEIQNYYEKFKKEITRKTTKVQIVGTQTIWPSHAFTLGQLTHHDLASVRISK